MEENLRVANLKQRDIEDVIGPRGGKKKLNNFKSLQLEYELEEGIALSDNEFGMCSQIIELAPFSIAFSMN